MKKPNSIPVWHSTGVLFGFCLFFFFFLFFFILKSQRVGIPWSNAVDRKGFTEAIGFPEVRWTGSSLLFCMQEILMDMIDGNSLIGWFYNICLWRCCITPNKDISYARCRFYLRQENNHHELVCLTLYSSSLGCHVAISQLLKRLKAICCFPCGFWSLMEQIMYAIPRRLSSDWLLWVIVQCMLVCLQLLIALWHEFWGRGEQSLDFEHS